MTADQRAARWRIRDYRPEDWEAVSRVHDAARLDELRDSVGTEAFLSLADTYESEGLFDGRVWVAEETAGERPGDVVGFVALDEDEVSWLYVDPARYGEGAGTALLRHAVSRGGPCVEATVLAGNERAIGFYLRAGFTIRETRSGRLVGNEAFPATGHVLEYRAPDGPRDTRAPSGE
ncbi:GNAT family N-acetyltransferase [Streptomyces sp. ACA25]|uniref:GNAT family N-acetyltransferase n=1 Tax=Streptomyces sp. ACA25 TaxID=3022596 RepID=UPI00230816A4|nr:GNAT family N-acetyltransferase [Streptomyces sp. ACA25]MDB1086575.1 GNAT family N-acetyltransferase [Streptomyces sp. ACA25]